MRFIPWNNMRECTIKPRFQNAKEVERRRKIYHSWRCKNSNPRLNMYIAAECSHPVYCHHQVSEIFSLPRVRDLKKKKKKKRRKKNVQDYKHSYLGGETEHKCKWGCQKLLHFFPQAILLLGVYPREIFQMHKDSASLVMEKNCKRVHQQETGWTHFVIAVLWNPIAAIKREWCVSLCTVMERPSKSIIKQEKNSKL